MRLIDADACREDFMQEVYAELESDPDNERANRIIDLFDMMPTIETPRVWTPCAERMPTPDEQKCNVMDAKKYCVTVDRYDEYYPQVAICRTTPDGAEWQTLEGHKHRYPAISWQPIEPYNPDHIGDANKKVED